MTHTALKRRCFGYVRVSTTDQAERGDSLSVQRRAIELIAELEGYELVAVYADPGTSGGVPLANRPEGAKLMSAAMPGDIIISTRLDRMFRDTTDATGTLKALKKAGIGLYLKDLGGDVTDSSVSALVFGLLSAVAEFERARISERVTDVKASQRRQSRFLGGCKPLGAHVVVDDATGKQHIVADDAARQEARRLKALGYSARMAAGAMTGAGFPTTDKTVTKLWRDMGI